MTLQERKHGSGSLDSVGLAIRDRLFPDGGVMAFASHVLHLLILGLAGTVMLIAVLMGRNPLAQAPRQVRRITVVFLLIFLLLEMVDVLENPSSAPVLINAWAVLGLAMGSVASLLMLRVRPAPEE